MGMPDASTFFEFRLEGGVQLRYGPPRLGDGGVARLMRAPAFCDDPALERCRNELTRVHWELRPLDREARRTLARAVRMTDLVDIASLNRGVGLLRSTPDRRVEIALWLPVGDYGRTGLTTFEDWMRLITEVKDDLNREALLRLHYPDLGTVDLAAFREGKRIATTGVELVIKPRMIQWARDC